MSTSAPLSAEASAFRNGMSRLGSAVNLVTTDGASGRHGLTVSAVCSVTDSPPTLLVCINQNAYSHGAFVENGVLCVNVLGSGHRELSRAFSRYTGEDRFALAKWSTLATAAPALDGASVNFDCRIVDRQTRGTHTVFFCEVQATRQHDAVNGLIWFDRGFHALSANPSNPAC